MTDPVKGDRPERAYEGWRAGDPMAGIAESLHDAIGHLDVELHGNDSAPVKAARWRIEDALRKLEAGEAFGPTPPMAREPG